MLLGELLGTSTKPYRPATLLLRLKDMRDYHITGKLPPWYEQECKDNHNNWMIAFTNLMDECIKEIEMHQTTNGELYKRLYPNG